jgi:hypothetical protein
MLAIVGGGIAGLLVYLFAREVARERARTDDKITEFLWRNRL